LLLFIVIGQAGESGSLYHRQNSLILICHYYLINLYLFRDSLTDYSKNKSHNRHIHYKECQDDIGLNLIRIEDDAILQDLVLSVHHCFMHTMMNTHAYKIIENHLGTALVKQEVVPARP